MSKRSEIVSFYNSQLSQISSKLPVDLETLMTTHKNAINNIKTKFSLKTLTPEIKKAIDIEFTKIQNKNTEMFKEQLQDYLTEAFKDIDGNVRSGNYKSTNEYKKDCDDFTSQMLTEAPQGPERESIIYQFVLDQLLIHSDMLIASATNEYEQKLNSNKSEMVSMSSAIQDTKDEHAKLLKLIQEKESQIKAIENEKTEMMKRGLKDTDKLGKQLKDKNTEISKLKERIENAEFKNTKTINELKSKLDIATKGAEEKEKKIQSMKSDFDKKKSELKAKIDSLEKNLKDINNTKQITIKQKKETSSLLTKNTEIENLENQIASLNRKVSLLTEKKDDLELDIQNKEKALQNERKRCDDMIAEYEQKINEASQTRDAKEDEIKRLEEAHEESQQQLQFEYQDKISEIQATISQNKVIYSETEQKLREDLEKATYDLSILKEDNAKALARLEDIKSQISSDKSEYDKYIKILEENNKRLLSQYEETVKEKNMLKTQQESDILRINEESKNKVLSLTKDNERIEQEMEALKLKHELKEKELTEKINKTQTLLQTLSEQEEQLNIENEKITLQKNDLNTQFKYECEQIEKEHIEELEKLKVQCQEDIERKKAANEIEIEKTKEICEQEKNDLNTRLLEEEENNKQKIEDLANTYIDKIKTLEQTKDEVIEELTANIAEAEANHQAYVDEVEEDIRQHAKQIEALNEELNEATISLKTIQSTHNELIKSNYDAFQDEKEQLENNLSQLYTSNKELVIQISIFTTKNTHLTMTIEHLNEKILKLQNELQTLKEKNDNTIQSLHTQISDIEQSILEARAQYEQDLALKEQEINYVNEQIILTKNELEELQATFEEKLAQCKAELTAEYSAKLNELQIEKNELEKVLAQKKKEYYDLGLNYHSTTALLIKEKEVLSEKLDNVTMQTREIEENLLKEKEENLHKIAQLKKEHKERIDQLTKENEAIQQKLRQNEIDYNELQNAYDKDASLWQSRFEQLNEEKDKTLQELSEFKDKYNAHVADLQNKVILERERLEQIYRSAVSKREETFNKQFIDANALFAEKFNSVNAENQELLIENKNLIETLDNLNGGALAEKETRLALSKKNTEQLRKSIDTLGTTKDKEIKDLMKLISNERREATAKMIQLENKLREYETDKLFEHGGDSSKGSSSKDLDEQMLLIDKLRSQIAELEKTNARLSHENRDAQKENETMRKRNSSNSGLPRSRMNSNNKENIRTQSGVEYTTTTINKRNLLHKFNNQKEDDLNSYNGSNRNSVLNDDNE